MALARAHESGAESEPGGQNDARLCPREHPRDRTKIIDPSLRTAPRGPRAKTQPGDLLERRDRHEEVREVGIVVDHRAVERGGRIGHLLNHMREYLLALLRGRGATRQHRAGG